MTHVGSPIEPSTVYVELDTGIRLHTRQWSGKRRAFILLHGLSSNCTTWDGVAKQLAASGHPVVTVDQRGHGLSDKPHGGYDFASISADLASLLEQVDLERPIVAGQSWGGNVALEFGARYPAATSGLAFVDGGFLDLQGRSGNDWDPNWEAVSARLRPPDVDGMKKSDLEARVRHAHPDWPDWGIEATMRNFEWLSNGAIRRWLPVAEHMKIVRALWEQRPPELYPLVQKPVLICPADDDNQEWVASKIRQVSAAQAGLVQVEVHWFRHTHHDIHIERSNELARLFIDSLEHGVWADA